MLLDGLHSFVSPPASQVTVSVCHKERKNIHRYCLSSMDKFESSLENPIPLRILYPSTAASGLVGLLMSWGNVQL